MIVHIDIPRDPGALAERAAAILIERMRNEPDLQVTLTLDPALPAEGFRIESRRAGKLRIAAGDERGLIYGVGKLLRAPGWRGSSVPARLVRGMYFASHFGNFYEAAAVERLERYVEDLALWGCNALAVWFDMHQYAGLADPAAQSMIERLRRVLKAAAAVGIRGGLTTLANEGYSNSPEALRADWTAGHDGYTAPPGGHYHREICPSKPGGLETILETRRQMLEAFADLDIAYVWVWPYDQGGCTCGDCAPWGANGFLRTAEPVARLIREMLPAVQIVLSTWYFDHFTTGEWEGLTRAFAGGAPDWADWLMAGDFGGFPQHLLEHGSPGGLPVLSFPEISMEGNAPWGGYGMNPRPATWEAYQRRNGSLLSGTFPYSEGIYEDMNKALLLQLNWDMEQPASQIIREYAAFAFTQEVAEDTLAVVAAMEAGLGHTWAPDVREQVLDAAVRTPDDLRGRRLYRMPSRPDARATFARVESIGERLPERMRASWRWRLFWLRAAIDLELEEQGGVSTDRLDGYLSELTAIYGTGEDAGMAVTPPTREALFRLIRAGRMDE